MQTRQLVRNFVSGVLQRKGDEAPFADDDSLLLSGRIDSLNVLEIVSFLEKEFKFDIGETVFDPTSFDSVDSIMELVEGSGRQV